jgi:hypothetical protein
MKEPIQFNSFYLDREKIMEIFERTHKNLEVVTFLQALQKTIDCENELTDRFAKKNIPEVEGSKKPRSKEKAAKQTSSQTSFQGLISTSFDPYMSIYIIHEDG